MNLQQLVASLLVGVVVGAIFSALRLPIPAPRALAGVLGITGIYLGYELVTHWDKIMALLPF